MSFIQQQEEADFSNSYNRADRFAGFDRGDAGRDDVDACDTGERTIGRMTSGRGQRVEIVESYCDDLSHYSVLVDGRVVARLGEDRARAVEVARARVAQSW